jgi:uncharacterized protein YjbI with pentapeptide repeats
MAIEDPVPQAIVEKELAAIAAGSRIFSNVLLPATLALDGIDFTESRFERCLFRVPAIRSADFLGAAFKTCTFESTRFASCKLAGARFDGCALFDPQQKKGCTFAFCDMQAAEAVNCNFATSSFERCDLYNVHAVDCSFRSARFHQSTFIKALSKR